MIENVFPFRRAVPVHALFAVILLVLTWSPYAKAQEIKPLDVYQDPHGIDLTTNHVSTSKSPTMSIPAAPELTFRDLADFVPVIEVKVGMQQPGYDSEIYRVSAGSLASDAFASCTTSMCYSAKGTGSRLQLQGDIGGEPQGLGGYWYTQGGTGRFIRFELETEIYPPTAPQPVRKFLAYDIINPGGADLSFEYETTTVDNAMRHRPSVVTSRSGYQLRFTYWSNQADSNWGFLKKAVIVAQNNPTQPLASLEFNGNTVTDLDNRVFECVCMPHAYFATPAEQKGSRMKLPGMAANSFDTSRSQNSHTRTVTSDGVTFTYVSTPDQHWPHVENYGSDGTWKRTMDKVTITGPDGYYMLVDVTNVLGPEGEQGEPRRRIDSITDSQNRTTHYEYSAVQRLRKIIYPEGNAIEVSEDSYGNLTARRAIAKPGSGQADLLETAGYSYSGSCTFAAFDCYNPVWVKDAKGNQTDLTWSSVHGGLLTQLDPVNAQNRRRKVVNTWSDSSPINGESCGIMGAGQLGGGTARCIPRLLREEICDADINGNCGSATSYVRTFTYFGATRLPASETITDGAGNAPLTTTYSYDAAGRLLMTDGPLPGTDDATYARYDIVGRKIWEIGPKGENGRRPATKTTYRAADDQVTKVETGTVPGNTTATYPATPTLSDATTTETAYDTRRLPRAIVAKGSDNAWVSRTNIDYDTRNRERCRAVRMSAGSASWNACAAQSGVEGYDRITRKHYDTESRVTRIEQGVGTTLRRDYATYTFTPNGQMASMTDARGYKASMLYDGFDRQTHWYFPNPSVTGAINSSDYERYTYDANGNRLTLRKRDGSVLGFAYDKLNRVTRKTVTPHAALAQNLDPTHSRDVFYRYDIRGLQTDVRFDSLTGQGTQTIYDRYGRVTRNTDTMDGVSRQLNYLYDVAGNRTQLRFPDAVNVNYTYSSGGQFNQVKDHAGVVIADYNYNTHGELSQVNRDSTAPDQNWTYDTMGRLATTGWSNAGSSNVTWSFTRNPASQIRTETQTNDAYSWDGHVNAARSYVTNGLNQYTSVAGQAYCHDKNGNLTLDGQYVYLYDVENRLVEMRAKANTTCTSLAYTGQIKAKLRYDPLGRLHEVEGFSAGVSQGKTRFLHDGDALVAEYNASGAMMKRYVHGPAAGADDPIAEYTGTSTAASARRNLYADARGSIVLSTATTGTAPQINTYDAYGVPGSSNTGRFQYTGQVWLPELGMNYYKARMYSPLLGRFMQTDPIGYEDNVNLYSYVANDPINNLDPTGTRVYNDPPRPTIEVETPQSSRRSGRLGRILTGVARRTGLIGAAIGISYALDKLTGEPKRMMQVFRVYGGAARQRGEWWSTTDPRQYETEAEVRNDFALKPEWGNTLERVATGWVDAKNVREQGIAAPQILEDGSVLSGGAFEVRVTDPDTVQIVDDDEFDIKRETDP